MPFRFDSREPREIKDLCRELIPGAEEATLEVGDFDDTDDGFVAERKHDSDLSASLSTRRFRRQRWQLAKKYCVRAWILESSNWQEYYTALGDRDRRLVNSALVSVVAKYRIELFYTFSRIHTVNLVKWLYLKSHELPEEPPVYSPGRDEGIEEQAAILTGIAGIASETALKIIAQIGRIKEIKDKSAKELQQLDGIGPKLAQRIFDAFN